MNKSNYRSRYNGPRCLTVNDLWRMCQKREGQCNGCPFSYCVQEDLRALMNLRYRSDNEARHERIEGERSGKAIDKDHRPKGNVFVYYDPIVKKYVSVNRQLDSDINKAIRKSTFNGALEDFYRMSEFPNIEIKEVNL